MPRLTVTITEEQADLLEEKTGDCEEYESKSEAVREFIQRYERLSEQVDELERENDRLRREKRLILEQREETQQLQRYAETEKAYREAGLKERLKWWIWGREKE